MTIQVKCGSCGRMVGVPEKYAGKKIKCPGCETPFIAPAAKPEAGHDPAEVKIEIPPDFEMPTPLESQSPAPLESMAEDRERMSQPAHYHNGATGMTRDCPSCGEEIRAAAKRCRHCSERLGGSDNAQEVHLTGIPSFRLIGIRLPFWDAIRLIVVFWLATVVIAAFLFVIGLVLMAVLGDGAASLQ